MRGKKTDKQILRESEALDKSYAESDKFHAEQFEKFLRENFEALCRRTDYPKLGYIIDRLNKLEIPCCLHGSTAHAEHILWVQKTHLDKAAEVLEERHGRYRLDDVRDDHPKFNEFKDVKPDAIEE